MKPLTRNEWELLYWLDDEKFCSPMEIGGRDGSYHSPMLARMAKRGLVERVKRHAIYCPFGCVYNGKTSTVCRCRGSCKYRRTPAGKEVLLQDPQTGPQQAARLRESKAAT